MLVQSLIEVLKLVVREGFEPSKLTRQSYSLFPLTARESHHFTLNFQCCSSLYYSNSLRWCRHTDSNCGPTDYKSVALPTELCRLFLSVSYVSYRNGVQFSKKKNLCKCFFQKKREKLINLIHLMIIQPL